MDTEKKQTETVQAEVVPTEQVSQPASAPVQTNTTTIVQPKKRRSMWITCCAVLFILFLCISVCVGGAFALFGVGFRQAKQDIVEMVCDPRDSDIEAFYGSQTTDDFQKRVTLEEFRGELDQLSGKPCDELRALRLSDIRYYIQNNWNYSSSTTNGRTVVEFTGKIGGKEVTFKTVKESGSSRTLIDDFIVR